MSCSKSECLRMEKHSSTWSREQLAQQLNACNKCVMYHSGGIKEGIESYKRSTRSTIGLLYARQCFKP